MKKRLPIGISDFKKIIDENYVYVDKTLLIQEILERGAEVLLIPRMRRFGKTLNLSMLRYFFEKTDEDTSHLFTSLNIWKTAYSSRQGQYPVIFLTLKDTKHSTWERSFEDFCNLVATEFDRHAYLLEGALLSSKEKEDYHLIVQMKASQLLVERSLLMLSKWLNRYYNKRVVLLIDEYDTPVHAAYVYGYYEILIEFLRNWLSAGLKDNSVLEFGVLTGILRIAKESIFSGLNNISTFSILNTGFQDKFGFLESEVKILLQEHGLQSSSEKMRSWYDGYNIGSQSGMYNPWSVLKCIEAKGVMASYWVNTSDNALMSTLITQSPGELKADLEKLLKGEFVEKSIEEGIVFTEFTKNPDSIWALLLFTGYLTLTETTTLGKKVQLQIPNLEVRELYHSLILNWFKESVQLHNYELLIKSLISGDVDTFSRIFQDFFFNTFSVFDVTQEHPERVYHAFVLGVLIGLKDRYDVRSNRESGLGRYDVILFPKNSEELGIIMEFKKVDRFETITLEDAVESALKQIEEKHYAAELWERGVTRILYMGLAFERKRVLIRSRYGNK